MPKILVSSRSMNIPRWSDMIGVSQGRMPIAFMAFAIRGETKMWSMRREPGQRVGIWNMSSWNTSWRPVVARKFDRWVSDVSAFESIMSITSVDSEWVCVIVSARSCSIFVLGEIPRMPALFIARCCCMYAVRKPSPFGEDWLTQYAVKICTLWLCFPWKRWDVQRPMPESSLRFVRWRAARLLIESCMHPPGWCADFELWLSLEHTNDVLLCGQIVLIAFRIGSVVCFFWFQSRFVSASPTRLVSSWLRLERLVAMSLFVGFIPWQFWKTILRVCCGLGSVGRLLIECWMPDVVVMLVVIRVGRIC